MYFTISSACARALLPMGNAQKYERNDDCLFLFFFTRTFKKRMFNLYTNVVPVNEHTETGIHRRVCVFFSRKSGPSNKSHRGTIIKTGDTVVQKPKRAFRIQRENTLNGLSADAKRRIVRQNLCLVRIRYTRTSCSVRLRAFLGPIRQANTVFKQRSQHVLTTFFKNYK